MGLIIMGVFKLLSYEKFLSCLLFLKYFAHFSKSKLLAFSSS